MKPTQEELLERDLLGVAARLAGDAGTTVDLMCSRDRHKQPSAARHALWAHLRALGWSYPSIGRLFDRDHTTVMKVLKAKAPPTVAVDHELAHELLEALP